jgi:hypothetical protein
VILAVLFADSSVSYPVFAGAIGAVAATLTGAIGLLWRRIDRDSLKCVEERESLYRQIAAESKEWFARVETLHKERASETEKMLAQIVKMTEKSEEARYATLGAINDCTKSNTRVEQALNSLNLKSAEMVQGIKAINERRP